MLLNVWGFPGGRVVKRPVLDFPGGSAWVWFPDGEDLLEEEMEIYSSILAWEIPWTEEPDGLQSMGFQRVRYDWVT